MSMFVRRSCPALPERRRYFSGRPAYGPDAQRLLESIAHLAGYARRPVTAYVVSAEPPSAGVPGPPGPDMSTVTHRLLHRVTPRGRYLALHIDYTADDDSSGNPSIVVSCEDSGGGAVDVGCEWVQDDGTLPGASLGYFNGAWIDIYYPLAVHGTDVPGPDDATAGAPSRPRMLDVSTLYGTGGIVDLIVETTACRLLSLTVEEYPEMTLDG